MNRYEDFCLDTLCKQFIRDSFVGFPSCLIIVEAKTNRFYIGIVLQHLEHNTVADSAAGGLAVLLPTIFMHGDIRQHIYGSLKQIELVA